jgi:hypothetical protein
MGSRRVKIAFEEIEGGRRQPELIRPATLANVLRDRSMDIFQGGKP